MKKRLGFYAIFVQLVALFSLVGAFNGDVGKAGQEWLWAVSLTLIIGVFVISFIEAVEGR